MNFIFLVRNFLIIFSSWRRKFFNFLEEFLDFLKTFSTRARPFRAPGRRGFKNFLAVAADFRVFIFKFLSGRPAERRRAFSRCSRMSGLAKYAIVCVVFSNSTAPWIRHSG